ncbi:putative transposable element [Trichonephila clavipes]|nr:putative transposable element [Trichonephila clavipes]
MTAQQYVHGILLPHVLSLMQRLPGAIFQQDNARPHTARISQICIRAVTNLPWPARSPDLSPIEHIGNHLGSCQVIYSQFGLAIHQNDHQARRRFVEWAQNEIAVVPDFHKRILFSDEAHFWLNGYVNKQNCRIWSEANTQVPYFFKNDEGHNVTVNGDRYRAMITNFFIPELNNHDVQELWFQQDGATCHTARATIDLLKDTFGDRLISHFGPVNWPPRSCDLTPLDYFLWGYVKSLVYADKPQTLDHLEDNIRRVIADIRPPMLEKVIENWTSRLYCIRASRGGHMPEIIFKIVSASILVVELVINSRREGNESCSPLPTLSYPHHTPVQRVPSTKLFPYFWGYAYHTLGNAGIEVATRCWIDRRLESDQSQSACTRRKRSEMATQLSLNLYKTTGISISPINVAQGLNAGSLHSFDSEPQKRPSSRCPEHLSWTGENWGRVFVSDESRFSLDNNSSHVLIWI